MQQILSLWREQITLNNLKMIILATLHRWQQVWLEKANAPFFILMILFSLVYIILHFYTPIALGAFFSILPFVAAVVIYLSRVSVGAKSVEDFARIFMRSLIPIIIFDVIARILFIYFERFFGIGRFSIIVMSILYVFFMSWFILAIYDQKNFFVSLRAAGTLMIAYVPIVLASISVIFVVGFKAELLVSYLVYRTTSGVVAMGCILALVAMLLILVSLIMSTASVMYIRVVHNQYDLLYK